MFYYSDNTIAIIYKNNFIDILYIKYIILVK